MQNACIDQSDFTTECILVILPSTHSPTELTMQKEDNILEWIFLAHKQRVKS